MGGEIPAPGEFVTVRGSSLTPLVKVRFLELAERNWPNLTVVLKAVGASKRDFEMHMRLDRNFRDRVEGIRDSRMDVLESVMLAAGLKPRGFMDRMAMLRAYRPGVWNPDRKMEVQVRALTDEEERRRGELLRRAVEIQVPLGDGVGDACLSV